MLVVDESSKFKATNTKRFKALRKVIHLFKRRVILTGTPHGVGMAAKPQPRWLKPGDRVDIEIESIGTLSNPVALEPRGIAPV
jgi:protein involved in polysaccharide export with SLBB domain